ncbi:MAG: ATP-binding protein [Lachnospiraceae bacterium]|nr:ATP-binding protein [Lachnospiraceae bacterium]
MAFTNIQFESIKRVYDERRMLNQAESDRRRVYVEENIPGFKELSDKMVSLSMEHAKQLLAGNVSSSDEYKKEFSELSDKKKELLKNASLPEDYLSPIYTCKDCMDTGYIDGQRCHCLKKMAVSMLYNNSNINDYLKSVDFSMVSDKYYTGDELTSFKDTYNNAVNFVKNFDNDFKNLVIYGTVGSGKSLISACIARSLIEKEHTVLYFSASALMDLFSRYSFDYKKREDLYSSHSDIFESDLLIIDDLGTEQVNSFTISTLFTCLNERFLNKRSTIISTNLSPKAIAETYTERIYSRLVGGYTFCKLYGPDIRFKTKFDRSNA